MNSLPNTQVSNALLPVEFADLQEFAPTWCLASEAERFEQRMCSTIAELQAFHDAFLPRLESAMEFLDRYELHELPPEAERLLQLVHSLVMVSMAVEIFHQVRTVDAANAVLDRVGEPLP